MAPSGSNLQPCEFIIVDKKEVVDSIFPALQWAGYIKPKGTPPSGKRPTAYIVTLLNRKRRLYGGEADVAAAIQNILLVATEKELGACWIGSIDRKVVGRILKIPGHCKIAYIVALGYPDERPVPVEMSRSHRYWKNKKNVLHIPKRKLSDILHRNRY